MVCDARRNNIMMHGIFARSLPSCLGLDTSSIQMCPEQDPKLLADRCHATTQELMISSDTDAAMNVLHWTLHPAAADSPGSTCCLPLAPPSRRMAGEAYHVPDVRRGGFGAA